VRRAEVPDDRPRIALLAGSDRTPEAEYLRLLN
jgi:hypothetical protein